MSISFRQIKTLFSTGGRAGSRWLSYTGLGIGVLLLLVSLQMFLNIQKMLRENVTRKNGYDFISITKTITNETMGQVDKNSFTTAEIRELSQQQSIDGVSPLLANQFRVQLSAGAIIPFQTDLFIETLDNEFIDTVPPNFTWQEGQVEIPIIFSSDFLEIYNVFAPGQGLPQISEETASGIPILITCEGNGLRQTFRGKVIAFSDRVNSVLVPKTFLTWANKSFGNNVHAQANRLFIKAKDANNAELLDFLDSRNYKVNKDKTKFGRVKQVLQGIFTALGVFGLLVVILALMLFSFYLQLMIARSKDNIQLLLTLGYSPAWLSKAVSRQFIPVYLVVIISALVLTQILQFIFQRFAMYSRPEVSPLVHWSIVVAAVALMALSAWTNYRMVKKTGHAAFLGFSRI